ncbi:hypothetical protein D1007_37903 [Hordeum vulgare]|nr:hypothetical protein D1007_37903 [Hordeum vulgare]
MRETSHGIKRGNHLPAHCPYHFPQIPSLSHRLPLPNRHQLALLHYRLAVSRRILFLTFIASIYPMAEAHGDAGAAAGDVAELRGAVTVDEVKDVGGVHGGAGKLATATDVDKDMAVSAIVLSEQKYDSGEDVYKGNFKSFKAKEVEKIEAKGVASFLNRKIKKWCYPYYTTKAKPTDGRFDHLVSHEEDVAIRGEDYMIRGLHAALAKALTPV